MDSLSQILAGLSPYFVCGFVVQQAVEIFDQTILSWTTLEGKNREEKQTRTMIFGLFSLTIAFVISFGLNLNILQVFNFTVPVNNYWGTVVSAIFISGGTAGFNSVMKFLQYAKESKQTQANTKK